MGKRGKDVTSVFNEIYDATTTAALKYISSKCGDMEDISDILQDTYMEVYSTILEKGTDFIKNDEAFVINIAKKKIFKHYNKIQSINAEILLSAFEGDNGEITLDLQPDEFDIEDSVCTNELVEEIQDYVKTKPIDIQKIFFLRFSLDLSINEIASLMDEKESNVKNKLYRTIREIREIYREKGEVI